MGAVMKTSYCFFAGAVGSSRCQCGRRCGIKFRIAPLWYQIQDSTAAV